MCDTQIAVKLITKQLDYAVPDSIHYWPGNVSSKELNSLINSLLKESIPDFIAEEFDFLIFGELLRSSVLEILESKNENTEQIVEVEYFTKFPAPTPENSLIHDDWVSGVNTSEKWILSGCYDSTIHIWDINGEHKLTIPGHTAPVKSVAWLKNGDPVTTFVSTSHDETALLWHWNQVTNAVDCINICKGHARSVDCVAVSPDTNRFATGSYDQMLKIWSADSEFESASGDDDKKRFKSDNMKSKVKTPLMTLSGHTDGISGLQWIDTNEICTCSLDCTLRIWNIELGGLKGQLNGSKAFLGISYSPLNRMIISGSSDRFVRLWDPRSKDGSIVKTAFSSHNLWITSVHWSPVDEHQFVSGSMDCLVKLWDTRSTKAPLFDISGHEDKVFCVDWSMKNLIISGGADNHMRLYKFKEEMQSDSMES